MKPLDAEWTTFQMDRTNSRPLALPRAGISRWTELWAAVDWGCRSWIRPADADADWEQDG